LVGRLFNTMVEHVIARARSYTRRTEDCDQISAGQMTRKAEGLYSQQAKYSVMVSTKDTKIDGEHIFMG
jgi:hypothetical protein